MKNLEKSFVFIIALFCAMIIICFAAIPYVIFSEEIEVHGYEEIQNVLRKHEDLIPMVRKMMDNDDKISIIEYNKILLLSQSIEYKNGLKKFIAKEK